MFLSLIGLAVWASARVPTFRGEEAIRFDRMSNDEVIIRAGLTRRQLVYLKIGYVERLQQLGISQYGIGVFGSHQVKYFSSEAFGWEATDRKFFNFWAAANRLHDEANYLEFLQERNALPDVLLMAITTPNNDNGGAMIGSDPNMPISRIEFSDYFQAFQSRDWDRLGFYATLVPQLVDRETSNIFNYITFLIGLFRGDQVSIVDLKECADILAGKSSSRETEHNSSVVSWLMKRMPQTVKNAFGKTDIGFYCQPARLQSSVRADGSSHFEHDKLILNQRILADANSEIRFGDEDKIVSALLRIYGIAETAGRKIAFFVPPVYETERYGLADRVFSRALEILRDEHPEVFRVLIDDRYAGRGRPEIFNIYDHPNRSYYLELVDKLRDLGVIGQFQGTGS